MFKYVKLLRKMTNMKSKNKSEIIIYRGLVMELNKESLLMKIEYLRKELLNAGAQRGYGNPETIRISQNLDELILKYQKLTN